MPIIAPDGFEYADFTQRLLGRPAKNTRNCNVQSYRATHGEEAARLYAKGFDLVCPEGDPGPSSKFRDAHYSGFALMRPATFWHKSGASSGAGVSNPVAPAPAGLHPAHKP